MRQTAVLLCTVIAAPALAGIAQSPDRDRFAPLDAIVQRELTRSGAPGAAVAIVERDRVVFAKGYGVASVETQTAVTADTLFQIGSVTKTFTAAALMSASADGVLSLDATAGNLVPGLRPCIGRVTLAQLLSHSSGLIDEPDEFGPQGEDGLGSYQRTWGDEYCFLPPGRAFSYSNSGFSLAGLALQEREKKPFADIMRARVLDPLGMTRTTFRPTEAMTWPIALGHRREDGVVKVVRPLPNDARLWPAGTLYSSANEMARMAIALANDGRVGGRQALPRNAVRTMTGRRMHVPTTDVDYGYGLWLDRSLGSTRAGHAGQMTGYVAVMGVLLEPRIGVAVLANGDNAPLGAVSTAAMRLALGQPAEASTPAPAAPPSFALPAAALDDYVGTFSNPRRLTVDVVRQGSGLVLRRFGRDFPMRPSAQNQFVVEGPGGTTETIAFGVGTGGRADYLQMSIWALARTR